ncbi:hypothetical protein QSH18_00915 [Xanthomonas sp. NCPPB 2654]|uniref:hypothetical protein n=1 Tax=unclassified Xanthomonas TaxID=2643310 RepID=UPI0021DF5694|nr:MULTISPECIES: hypothetical protein [unclassified Xanthomonas]MDL5364161.1 hypothetical protein [Xanthomonas sp. NCPPB 2654]UYC20849.1 hypothetical protein NUG20_00605 [Xanthomonas sp. CFBP 8443]
MITKDFKVTALARLGVDLHNLAKSDGPLAKPCGTVGPSIARKVLAGDGQAEISILDLKIATDTQSGVEAILDNFELYDPKTKTPLFGSLIAARLKG